MSQHEGFSAYRQCVDALRQGSVRDAYHFLPHISVCKEKRLLPVATEILFSGTREREELAACALAAICDPRSLPDIFRKLEDNSLYFGPGSHRLQTALIEAVGEIGEDSASDRLLSLFNLNLKGDTFRRKRRVVILDALGTIALQGGDRALKILTDLLSHEDFLIRANAISNISTAFWHRPNELPAPIFEKLLGLFKDNNLYVQYSLISAMENLADVGCRLAADIFAT